MTHSRQLIDTLRKFSPRLSPTCTMANLISLQLPITHPGTYRVSFTPPTSGVL
ncbi:hypothetical protein BKA82DRAFT_4338709, partial [Pisolithus tinctorius]